MRQLDIIFWRPLVILRHIPYRNKRIIDRLRLLKIIKIQFFLLQSYRLHGVLAIWIEFRISLLLLLFSYRTLEVQLDRVEHRIILHVNLLLEIPLIGLYLLLLVRFVWMLRYLIIHIEGLLILLWSLLERFLVWLLWYKWFSEFGVA